VELVAIFLFVGNGVYTKKFNTWSAGLCTYANNNIAMHIAFIWGFLVWAWGLGVFFVTI
jgi:hypothetical protein